MKNRAIVSLIVGVLLIFTAVSFAEEGEKMVRPKAVKAIDWSILGQFLPEKVEGWKAGDLDGGTMNMADPTNPSSMFSYSSVEKTYKAKNKRSLCVSWTPVSTSS